MIDLPKKFDFDLEMSIYQPRLNLTVNDNVITISESVSIFVSFFSFSFIISIYVLVDNDDGKNNDCEGIICIKRFLKKKNMSKKKGVF